MKAIFPIFIIIFCNSFAISAQDAKPDSVYFTPDTTFKSISGEKRVIKYKISNDAYKPDPMKVLWMGAIIPGYGQILNRSYWKLPIVYGGFVGCAYAISLNSGRYETYKLAYRDITDTNEKTTSYLELFPPGFTIDNYPGGMKGLETNLLSFYEQYRRYRDLSIILSVVYYGLTLVEAYVEAQLFDFDISNDLSLHIRPSLLESNSGRLNGAGIQLSLKLK